jgi:hypothetical protein
MPAVMIFNVFLFSMQFARRKWKFSILTSMANAAYSKDSWNHHLVVSTLPFKHVGRHQEKQLFHIHTQGMQNTPLLCL